MTDARPAPRDRWGGIVGIAGVVIALCALPLAPPWPAADAPASAIRSYFMTHGSQFLLQNCIVWFGFTLFTRFFVGVSLLLYRAGERALAISSALGAALLMGSMIFGQAPWATLAYRTPESDDVILLLWNLGLVSAFNVAGLAMFAALLPLAIGVWRSGVLPKWFAILIGIETINGGILSCCFKPAGVFSPNGPFGLASIAGLSLMMLIGSALLLRRPSSPARAPGEPGVAR